MWISPTYTWTSYDDGGRTITINSKDRNDHGTDVTITIYSRANHGYYSSTNSDRNFRVRITDPCLTSYLRYPGDIAHFYVRDGQSGYEDFTDATDDWSYQYGEYYKCGGRNMVVKD